MTPAWGTAEEGDFINIFPLYVRTSKTTPDSSVYSTHIIVLKYQPSSVLCTNLRIYPGHD